MFLCCFRVLTACRPSWHSVGQGLSEPCGHSSWSFKRFLASRTINMKATLPFLSIEVHIYSSRVPECAWGTRHRTWCMLLIGLFISDSSLLACTSMAPRFAKLKNQLINFSKSVIMQGLTLLRTLVARVRLHEVRAVPAAERWAGFDALPPRKNSEEYKVYVARLLFWLTLHASAFMNYCFCFSPGVVARIDRRAGRR